MTTYELYHIVKTKNYIHYVCNKTQEGNMKRGREQGMREKLQAARKAKGLTQQAVADALGITLRHYQKIEYAEIGGSFEIWDALEDLLLVHQRTLRELSNNRPDQEESR